MYNDPEIRKTFVNVCPQTVSLDKRVVVLTMPFTVNITLQEDGGYWAESPEISGVNLWDERPVLGIDTDTKLKDYEKFNICHIRIPYIFMTENKNLTYYLTGPKSDTKHEIEGVKFAEGMLHAGQYGRSTDLAFVIPHNKTVTFHKGEPLVYLYFNDEIKLKEIIPNQQINNYIDSIYSITSYTRGVSKIFKKAKKRYPYKELESCVIDEE